MQRLCIISGILKKDIRGRWLLRMHKNEFTNEMIEEPLDKFLLSLKGKYVELYTIDDGGVKQRVSLESIKAV